MSCLRIDIKRLYNSITVRIVLGVLFFLAIVDPLYSRFLTLHTMESTLTSIGFSTFPVALDLKFIMHCFYFFLYYRLVLFYFMIRKPLSKYITLLNKVEQYI